eukprot:2643454-Rhodomonas_salina.2
MLRAVWGPTPHTHPGPPRRMSYRLRSTPTRVLVAVVCSAALVNVSAPADQDHACPHANGIVPSCGMHSDIPRPHRRCKVVGHQRVGVRVPGEHYPAINLHKAAAVHAHTHGEALHPLVTAAAGSAFCCHALDVLHPSQVQLHPLATIMMRSSPSLR